MHRWKLLKVVSTFLGPGDAWQLVYNGKLWILDTETNISLDSYRGPYTQTDEIDLNTYENQRWNAVSGVLGYKDGNIYLIFNRLLPYKKIGILQTQIS